MSFDLEVAAIGDDIDSIDIENGTGWLGCLRQKAHVDDLVGHGLLDDHLVLRVDGEMDIVAGSDFRMGGHRPAVGIGLQNTWAHGSA